MRFYVIVIDVAAPGRSVHHLGITPGGVICGHRDNSAIGRNLRARAPRLPALTLIRTADARPGIIAPGVIGLAARLTFYDRPAGDGAQFFLPHAGVSQCRAVQALQPVPAAATLYPAASLAWVSREAFRAMTAQ